MPAGVRRLVSARRFGACYGVWACLLSAVRVRRRLPSLGFLWLSLLGSSRMYAPAVYIAECGREWIKEAVDDNGRHLQSQKSLRRRLRILFVAAWRQSLWYRTNTYVHMYAMSAMYALYAFALHYITSHHITLHHITSHHITSHHNTSHDLTSQHITTQHITSHHSTSHHIT